MTREQEEFRNYVFNGEQAPKIHDQILKIVEQNLKLTDGKMDMVISCVFAHKKPCRTFEIHNN